MEPIRKMIETKVHAGFTSREVRIQETPNSARVFQTEASVGARR